MIGKSTPHISIYISSATTTEDLRLLDELARQLSVQTRATDIHFWDKRSIVVGKNRQQQIENQISQAQIILLLLSPDFLHDCYDEMQLITRRMMYTRDVHVIPILMRPTADLKNTPIGDLEPLPTDHKPVNDRVDREKALGDIAEHIGRIIEQRRLGPSKNHPLYTSPAQPNNFPLYTPLAQSGNFPSEPGFAPQPVKPRWGIGLIPAIIIIALAITVIISSTVLLPSLSHNTHTNDSTQNTNHSTGTALSAHTIDPVAASIITNVQAASAIDPTSKQPITPATSFRTNTNIYITFQLDLNGVDVSQQHPGYAQAKYYKGEHERISTSHVVTIDSNTMSGNSFLPFKYYDPTTTATVEVYWCREKNCSDGKLAQRVSFTVS